jgi:hypothetical protein
MSTPAFQKSHLWQRTLGEQWGLDDAADARKRLRGAFERFRDRAADVANEIKRDLPDFTDHDIGHLDALWGTADLVAGQDYPITPIEAFVLGSAFLIHDLGLGLAAYPGGLEELKRHVSWRDTVTSLLKEQLGRVPSSDQIDSPDEEIEQEAKRQVLVNLHASRAEQLPLISWRDQENDAQYYLIDDVDLRVTCGPLIGRVAHSHWWPVSKLAGEFGQTIGAHPGCPREWTLDPLKLACLLRVADASHLDAGRASGFRRALRRPREGSREHWLFLEKLQQLQLRADRVVFTSATGFPIQDAEAWWLLHDMLRMVDDELRQVDALLGDTGHERLTARSVAGAEEAMRLAELVKTDGWLPVDAKIRVTDVASLVEKLGGRSLYGDEPMVAVRELIQNATDAVRARRIHEGRPDDWGDITVRLGQDGQGHWLEVEDTGIGMSTEVLTGPFLDFGTTYWGSPLMQRELPGLVSKGFTSTGKYGIGFFSVFMLGDRVQVITRRPDEARADTRVLEFPNGVTARPLLRRARAPESLGDGGTRVRVRLNADPYAEGGLLFDRYRETALNLHTECAKLCPAIDANLHVEGGGGPRRLAVAASDWIMLDPRELLKRVWGITTASDVEYRGKVEPIAHNLRTLRNPGGQVVGRACVCSWASIDALVNAGSGVVTSGGIVAGQLGWIQGILVGETRRTARDAAEPVVDLRELARWATEQAQLVSAVPGYAAEPWECAAVIWQCGGDMAPLPVAEYGDKLVTLEDVCAWRDLPDELVIIGHDNLRSLRSVGAHVFLDHNVVAVSWNSYGLCRGAYDWPGVEREAPRPWWGYDADTLLAAFTQALAEAWSVRLADVVDASELREAREREVGKIGDAPLSLWSKLIRNPKKHPAGSG